MSLRKHCILRRLLAAGMTAVITLSMCTGGLAESYFANIMRLLNYEGEVYIIDETGEHSFLMENMRFGNGESLSTSTGSMASVGLDASKILTLDAMTQVLFEAEKNHMKLTLASGRLLLDVQEKLDENETFEIQTSTMVVGIRGTVVHVTSFDGTEEEINRQLMEANPTFQELLLKMLPDSINGNVSQLIVLEGTAVATYKDENGIRRTIEVNAGEKITLLDKNQNERVDDNIAVHKAEKKDLGEATVEFIKKSPKLLDKVTNASEILQEDAVDDTAALRQESTPTSAETSRQIKPEETKPEPLTEIPEEPEPEPHSEEPKPEPQTEELKPEPQTEALEQPKTETQTEEPKPEPQTEEPKPEPQSEEPEPQSEAPESQSEEPEPQSEELERQTEAPVERLTETPVEPQSEAQSEEPEPQSEEPEQKIETEPQTETQVEPLVEEPESQAHIHTPSSAVRENEVAATCLTAGSYDEVVYCEICGEEISRTYGMIDALGHDYGAWTVAEDATCSAPGVQRRTCRRGGCSAEEEESIAATGKHTASSPVRENEVAATCLTAGSYEEVVYCTVCGKEMSRTSVSTAALGHDYGAWTVAEDATCLAPGVQRRTCRRTGCGAEEEASIAATGKHTASSPVRENEVAATCLATGSYEEVVHCAVCGEEISRTSVTVPALGHDYGEWAVAEDATCSVPGVQRRTCRRTDCGAEEEASIAATGKHTASSPVRENEVAATCLTAGSYEEVVHCAVCGEEISRTSGTATALGHDYGEWVTAEDPTCSVPGVKRRTCRRTDCHAEEEASIPATGEHTASSPVRENEVAATCLAAGSYEEVVYCAVCGEEISRTSGTAAALGHDYGEWTVVEPPTCSETGLKRRTCRRTGCGVEEEASIPATGEHTASSPFRETEVEPTCVTEGSYEEAVYCTVCEEELSRTSGTVPALGHEWGEWTIITEPSCQPGLKRRTCTRCGQSEEEAIPATSEHEFVVTTETYEDEELEDNHVYLDIIYGHYEVCAKCGYKIKVEDSRIIRDLHYSDDDPPSGYIIEG